MCQGPAHPDLGEQLQRAAAVAGGCQGRRVLHKLIPHLREWMRKGGEGGEGNQPLAAAPRQATCTCLRNLEASTVRPAPPRTNRLGTQHPATRLPAHLESVRGRQAALQQLRHLWSQVLVPRTLHRAEHHSAGCRMSTLPC